VPESDFSTSSKSHAPLRLLEITGAKEPSALESLVKGVGVKLESVSRYGMHGVERCRLYTR